MKMTKVQVEMTTSQDMDCDHPSHVLTDGEIIEKIDDNHGPQVVEHLSTAGERPTATSTGDLENHTQDNNDVLDSKRTKAREKRKRSKANQSKKRDLSKNSSMQEGTTKISGLEPSDQAPVSAQIEELMGEVVEQLSAPGECSASSASKLIEGHAQVDNNSETKEKKSKSRRKKKRKLTSDSSLPPTEDNNGNAAEGFSLEGSNQVPLPVPTKDSSLEPSDQAPASAQIEELMGEVVEHLSYPGECLAASSKKDLESHAQVDNNLETKEMKSKKRREKKRKLKSDLSLPSREDVRGNTAEGFSLEVSNQVPVSAHTNKLTGEVVSVHEIASLINQNDSYPVGELADGDKEKEIKTEILKKSIDNDSEIKEVKFKKMRKKKRKLTCNSSLPSTEGNHGNAGEGFSVKVLNQVPVFVHSKELMGEVVSVPEPSFLTKQIDSYPAAEPAAGDKENEIKTEISEKRVEKHGILYDSPLKNISGKSAGQFNKSKLNAQSGTLNMETMPQDGVTISSELSETSDGDDVNPLNTAKEVTQPAPLRVHSVKLRRKLLVLDINGILTDIVNYAGDEYKPDMILSRKAVFKRPFCDDFLQFCFENFDVGIWSSRTMKNVKLAVDFLMGELQTKLLFCWDQSQCTDTGFTTLENREKPMLLKELKKLWEMHEPGLPWKKGEYNELNTLLLDDSPYKALRNPPYTAIFPIAYCYKNVKDNSLGPDGDLRVYLKGLASADDVQKYVEANLFGQVAISNKNASWKFYSRVICDTSLPARKSYNYQSSIKQSGLHQRRY